MARRTTGWKIYRRGKTLWVWWADGAGGKVRQRLTDAKGNTLESNVSSREANQAAAAAYDQWCRLAEGAIRQNEETEKLTLGILQRDFAKAHIQDWDERTFYDVMLYMKTLETFFGANCNPQNITARNAEKYKQWLLREGGRNGKPLASVTADNRFQHAVRVFHWAINMEYLDRNPFKKVKPIKAKPIREKEPFTIEETMQILNTCKNQHRWFYAAVLFVAVSGSRRGPIPFVKIKDFNAARGILHVRDEISKQDKGQTYYLPDFVADELRRVSAGRDAEDWLFTCWDGRQMNEKMFDKPNNLEKPPPCRAWYRLLKDARVKPRGIHNLRRAAVTNLVAANVSMDRVTAVTGQTVEVARDHYLQVDGADQRRTMEELLGLYVEDESDDESDEDDPVHLDLTTFEADALATVLKQQLRHEAAPKSPLLNNSGTNSGTNRNGAIGKSNNTNVLEIVAVGVGFEPTRPG